MLVITKLLSLAVKYIEQRKQEVIGDRTVDEGCAVFIGRLKEEGAGATMGFDWGGGAAAGGLGLTFSWLVVVKGALLMPLAGAKGAALLAGWAGGAGGAGGAAGGTGGKELVAEEAGIGEGFGATPNLAGAWFRFWFWFWFRLWLSFWAREVAELAVFPPKVALGATRTLANGWAAGGAAAPDAVLWLAWRLVLALSSSAQGAGGGRSPISGGGRKERFGLGAVGGGPNGFGAGAEEYWLGNCGKNNNNNNNRECYLPHGFIKICRPTLAWY